MELAGIIISIVVGIFVVVFGGRGLVDLVRGAAERRRARAASPVSDSTAASAEAPSAPLHQEVRFTTASDGVRIAYATTGEGPPLVKIGTWLTHLELDWESPIWRPLWTEASRDHTLVRYDMRGCGLSDWNAEDLSHEARVRDLEAVVDALDLARFALFGPSMGGPVAVEYAVRHPERVSHLVLFTPALAGRAALGEPQEEREARWTLIQKGWGTNDSVAQQLLTGWMIPAANAEQRRWLDELSRASTSLENVRKIRQADAETDVRWLAGQLAVPTVVLHGRGDPNPYERSRDFAAAVPNAQFVLLETANHILMEGEPAWDVFFAELRRFLGVEGAA